MEILNVRIPESGLAHQYSVAFDTGMDQSGKVVLHISGNWRIWNRFLEETQNQSPDPLKTQGYRKYNLDTCSIIWAFGKNSGSSFLFSPTDRKDTSPVRNQLEEFEQKLEEIWTEALNPLKLLESTKAILFTRSIAWAFGTFFPEALFLMIYLTHDRKQIRNNC